MRAGLGLLPGFLSVIDDCVVAHLGFFRDPETLAAVPYYANLPEDLSGADVFALDPMLATGHSGAAALDVFEIARLNRRDRAAADRPTRPTTNPGRAVPGRNRTAPKQAGCGTL